MFLFACLVCPGLANSIWDRPIETKPLDLPIGAHPVIVCDAGSTGSRCFGYYIQNHMVHTELLGRTMIGISSFADSEDFEGAAETLLPSIQLGIVRMGKSSRVHVLATGGVRQLEQRPRKKLIQGLHDVMSNKVQGIAQVKVVDGMDEALYGLFSANYLVGGLELHQVSDRLSYPIGVLDLGGSSLEISLAGSDDIMGSHDDLLYSFTDLGTNRVKRLLTEYDQLQFCSFTNGNGEQCAHAIRHIIGGSEELQKHLHEVKAQSVHKYVGISAFVYSMDFARWLMTLKPPISTRFLVEFPSPSVRSSLEACAFVCKVGNLTSLFSQHRYTTDREAPGRCFDVCYVSVIMESLLGDHEQTDMISFLAEARGAELEWTLGFYLRENLPQYIALARSKRSNEEL